MTQNLLEPTPLLDFGSGPIQKLISERGWSALSDYEKISSTYDYVRNEIRFGYNASDTIPASEILSDGYGQCNTKGILLMALLRGVGIACRFHGFTIDKGLQRGVVPELIYPIAPRNIIHSWVDVYHDGQWLNLEGFILDQDVICALQKAFPNRSSLCAYGAGTDALHKPDVEWTGKSTYIQRTGINRDLGVYNSPDDFYARHRQLNGITGFLYRLFIRHWMNHRVARIRKGQVPDIPGGNARLDPVTPRSHQTQG